MNIKVLLILLIAMLSVSSSPIIAYSLDISAITISFWRMFIGGILLWVISLFFKQKPLNKSNRFKTYIFGILLGLHFYFFFTAVKLTDMSNATLLGTIAPLFTMIIEIFWLKRKISINIIIWILMIVGGSIIIVLHDFDFSTSYTLGSISAIICSFLLGIGFIISEDVRQSESTISFSRTLYMSAALTLFILSFVKGESLLGFPINQGNILGLLALGIIPNMFGHNLLYYIVKYISPTIVASVPLGEPIIASVLAIFLFNIFPKPEIIVSGFIILSGLFFLIKPIHIDIKKQKGNYQ